jgi:hypothetical protein
MLHRPTIVIENVDPRFVMAAWPQLQRAFRKAQGAGCGDRMDEVEIVRALCEGSWELITASRDEEILGGVLLEFVARPRGKCCIVACSLFNVFPHRTFPEWAVQMNKHVIEYAIQCGCYTIEANARDGVVAELKRLGWRRKATVMEVKL